MQTDDRRNNERRSNLRRSTERRRPRLNVPGLPARLLRGSGDGKTVATGRLINISPTGVRLAVDHEARVGELLLIEVRLPSETRLNLAARVAWSKPQDDGFSVGCKLSAAPAGEKLAELRRLASGEE
jgi:hypothetical protein